MADLLCRGFTDLEMSTIQQRIDRDEEIFVGAELQQGTIIADAQRSKRVGGRVELGPYLVDELEFTHSHS